MTTILKKSILQVVFPYCLKQFPRNWTRTLPDIKYPAYLKMNEPITFLNCFLKWAIPKLFLFPIKQTIQTQVFPPIRISVCLNCLYVIPDCLLHWCSRIKISLKMKFMKNCLTISYLPTWAIYMKMQWLNALLLTETNFSIILGLINLPDTIMK